MLQNKYRTMLFVLFNNELITNNWLRIISEVIIQKEVINNTLRLMEKKSSKMLNKLLNNFVFFF